MRDSLLRNLRGQGRANALAAGAVLLTVLGLCLFSALTAPVDAIAETVSQNFAIYVPLACLLWSMGTSLPFYAVTGPYYLSMGSTRRGIFVVQQLFKVAFCGAGALFMFLCLQLSGNAPQGLGGTALLAFGSLLLMDSFGELEGLLAYRYGKWGMILYSVAIFLLCLFGGGLVGFFAASGESAGTAAKLLRWLTGLPQVGIAGLAVAAAALLSALTWVFFRRTAVKS